MHVFVVLYNSYSLQLFIADISYLIKGIKYYRLALLDLAFLASFLRRSKKSYTILKKLANSNNLILRSIAIIVLIR